MNSQPNHHLNGFIKRAEYFGIPSDKAMLLYKQAAFADAIGWNQAGDFLRTNPVTNMMKAQVQTNGWNPMMWGLKSLRPSNTKNLMSQYQTNRQNAFDTTANKYLDRIDQNADFVGTMDQGDGMLNNMRADWAINDMDRYRQKAMQYSTQLNDPNRIAHHGNRVLNAQDFLQQRENNMAQSAYDLQHARVGAGTIVNNPMTRTPNLTNPAPQAMPNKAPLINKPNYNTMSAPNAPRLGVGSGGLTPGRDTTNFR